MNSVSYFIYCLYILIHVCVFFKTDDMFNLASFSKKARPYYLSVFALQGPACSWHRLTLSVPSDISTTLEN